MSAQSADSPNCTTNQEEEEEEEEMILHEPEVHGNVIHEVFIYLDRHVDCFMLRLSPQ